MIDVRAPLKLSSSFLPLSSFGALPLLLTGRPPLHGMFPSEEVVFTRRNCMELK